MANVKRFIVIGAVASTLWGCAATAHAQDQAGQRMRRPEVVDVEVGYLFDHFGGVSSVNYPLGLELNVERPLWRMGRFRVAPFVGFEFVRHAESDIFSGFTSSTSEITDKSLSVPIGVRFEERLAKRAPVLLLDAKTGFARLSASDTTTYTIVTSPGSTQTSIQSIEDSENGWLLGADVGLRKEIFYFTVGYTHFFYSSGVNAVELAVGVDWRFRRAAASGPGATGATPGASFSR